MPNWSSILDEVRTTGSAYDVVRRRYLQHLFDVTGRNVIAYYSGWLQKAELQRQGVTGFELNDSDKNGFMAAIHGLDRSLGLDLLLHTPGGDTAATESIIDYLRQMFGTNIAIVPQIAMSGGTVIALASKQVVMGKHSSLGPIDPQIFGMPAHTILEEFRTAEREIGENPQRIAVWQPIIAKYTPTLIGECEKAIAWTSEMTREWLLDGMFAGMPDAEERAGTRCT